MLTQKQVIDKGQHNAGRKRERYKLQPDESALAKFKKWLAVFFIEKGSYSLTQKALDELGKGERRQFMEFAEHSTSREREERLELMYRPSRAEHKRIVAKEVEELIGTVGAEEVYNRGYVKQISDWKDQKTRITVVRQLIASLGTETEKIIKRLSFDEFREYGLSGLIAIYYKNSPYAALVEAGYAHSMEEALEHAAVSEFKPEKIYPWEMKKAPYIYETAQNRVAATKWLVWKMKATKQIGDIIEADLSANGLEGVLDFHKGSAYAALVEAGYAYSEEETIAHAAKREFRTEKLYPWEMKNVMAGFYRKDENKKAAVTWLLWKTSNAPRDITFRDFRDNGLSGLITLYENSPYNALLKLGFVTAEDEGHMTSNQHGHYS